MLKEGSVAIFQISGHQVIFAWEMPIKGRLCDLGDGHDLLGPGGADPFCVEKAIGSFKDPLPRLGLFLRIHQIYVDRRQTCLSILKFTQ